MFTPEVTKLGPDDQTARLNSGGDAIKAMEADRADEARSAADKYREQALDKLRRLGIDTLAADVPDDSLVLLKALEKIKAAGALQPVKERVTVQNQGGVWEFDVYHFPMYLRPGVRYSANEALLALSPDVVISTLRDYGFLKG